VNKIQVFLLCASVMSGLPAVADAQSAASASVKQTNAEQIAALHQQVRALKAQEAALEGQGAGATHNSTNYQTSPAATKARLEKQIATLQTRITDLQSKSAIHAKHNTEMLNQIGPNG
jgi:uncharacterized protein involved in exopolysaccharide biosynthesis